MATEEFEGENGCDWCDVELDAGDDRVCDACEAGY